MKFLGIPFSGNTGTMLRVVRKVVLGVVGLGLVGLWSATGVAGSINDGMLHRGSKLKKAPRSDSQCLFYLKLSDDKKDEKKWEWQDGYEWSDYNKEHKPEIGSDTEEKRHEWTIEEIDEWQRRNGQLEIVPTEETEKKKDIPPPLPPGTDTRLPNKKPKNDPKLPN